MERWELQQQCFKAFETKYHEEAVRLLHLQDPVVLRKDVPYLLRYSISNGWLDVTRELVTKYHFDPHKLYYRLYQYDDESCLYTAAKGNHIDIVEYLIKECRCDPMKTTTKYHSVPVLHYVASKGLLDVLKCIINECNCDIMVTDIDGVPFLHYVAREGLLDVLKFMVMNINGHIMDKQYRDTNGRTVLHCAVKHIDVVKYLINECNCDIMTPDKNGVPVLHYVASEGLLDVLKYIVMNINGHIMDKQYHDTNGRTVLHCAVKHIDVVKYLINECNCDIMTPDKNGVPALHHVLLL
uniref:Uncharacterized protein n=2 Tax=Amphimedon queenslandica TaxID=400682 RepID=A0A1X7T5I8_AMPQE